MHNWRKNACNICFWAVLLTNHSWTSVIFHYKIRFAAGKGDGNVRYYECVDEKPYAFPLSEHRTTVACKGITFLPKRACNVMKCETVSSIISERKKQQPLRYYRRFVKFNKRKSRRIERRPTVAQIKLCNWWWVYSWWKILVLRFNLWITNLNICVY